MEAIAYMAAQLAVWLTRCLVIGCANSGPAGLWSACWPPLWFSTTSFGC